MLQREVPEPCASSPHGWTIKDTLPSIKAEWMTKFPKKDSHAVVIGGSIAGLLSARVLSQHFGHVTIIERDTYPTSPQEIRAGTPQAWHHHVLLAKGRDILEEFFPGFDQEMEKMKVPLLDYGKEVALVSRVGELARFTSGVMIRPCRRSTLDWLVRKEVEKFNNITFMQTTRVTGLKSVESRSGVQRVVGVEISSGQKSTGSTKSIPILSDLVIDASGPQTQMPTWLENLNYPVPKEEVVDANLGYASRLYDASKSSHPPWSAIGITTRPPHNPRAAGLWKVEGGKWMCSLIGTAGNHPPKHEDGFLEFAKHLPDPRVYEFIKSAKPLGKIRSYRGTQNRWRHYESMKSFPQGLLVMGGAMCSYNPLYGQGMTVIAQQAKVLNQQLKNKRQKGFLYEEAFATIFHREIAKTQKLPWLLATLEDLRWPSTTGQKNQLSTKLANDYVDRLLPLARHDVFVAKLFLRIMNMQTSPSNLCDPRLLRRFLGTFVPPLYRKLLPPPHALKASAQKIGNAV